MFVFLLLGFACASFANDLPEHTKKDSDFSGVYDCVGDDAHEGKYTGIVTMQRKPEHSKGAYASYDFKLEVPEYGTYLGHAAVNGNIAAMHFALPQADHLYGGKTQDFGTGVATFKTNAAGKLTFHKFYFEPLFKGGNTGLEDCIKRD
jgi:hypothetical protein